MSKANTRIFPTAEMWDLMLEFTRSRSDEKKNEHDLIKARKKHEEDLNRMGDGPKTAATEEYRNVATAYTRTVRAIEAARSRIKFFADQIQECIERAAQGKLFDNGEVDALRKGATSAADAGLYADVLEDAGEIAAAADKRDAAAKESKGKKSPPVPAADAPWRSFGIFDTKGGLTGGDIQALKEVGLITMGQAYIFVHEQNHKLATVDGLSKKGAGALADLIAHYMKAKPAVEVVEAPAAKPGAGKGLTPKKTDPSGKKKPEKGGRS